MEEYMVKIKPILSCRTSQCEIHGATINSLAERGILKPVKIRDPRDRRRIAMTFNSMLTYCDWKKRNGKYKEI